MAFDLEAARKAGANDDQIIDYLKQSRSFDVAGALKAGADKNQIIGYLSSTSHPATQTTKPAGTENTYGALFPASNNDSGLTAGLKAAGNVPGSAIGLGKGIINTLIHPVETVKNLGNAAEGAIRSGIEKVTGKKLPANEQTQQAQDTFSSLASALKDRYGGLDNLRKTATNDPFGFGADVLSILEGGASLAGKSEVFNNAVSKTAQVAMTPVTKAAEVASDTVGKVGSFGLSQATGLNPETISTIANNPSEFSRANLADNNRVSLGQSVKDTIDLRLKSLKSTGAAYDDIRNGTAVANVPDNIIQDTLSKHGVQVGSDGKLVTTAESIPLSPTDKSQLQNFLDTYGKEKQLSSNAFLNTRSALSDLSRYEAGKTGNLQKISRDLRGAYDTVGKQQIPGLSELDAKYAPEVKQLNQIKKDYLTKDGGFKDGAINKIANLTGKGKDQVLSRLEAIHPGVTQRIKILKAAEDIQNASGLKVGTYARAALGAGGLATGNIPAIVGAIMSSPEIAVPLIKSYGLAKPVVGQVVDLLKNTANDVNNFRLPGFAADYVNEYLQNPKLGMSVQDVTRNIHPDDTKVMENFIDNARLGDKKAPLSDSNYAQAEKLAQKFGISMDKGLNGVAGDFEKILTGNKTVTGTKIPGSVRPKAK